jgi:hypothetical protein
MTDMPAQEERQREQVERLAREAEVAELVRRSEDPDDAYDGGCWVSPHILGPGESGSGR